ncbi:MAG: DUF2809 domain-containing protein [Lachnospiraceae bacterium]|nr:DUF2809 domain-containing protein [Lachnospiraceae bacterium]
MNKKRIIYLVLFLMLLLIEIGIALFVHEGFIRHNLGDILVVVLIYFFIKIFVPKKHIWLALEIFLFAVMVEILQYFRLVEILGVEDNVFLRTLIGSVYDVKDIISYGIGCIFIAICEWMSYRKRADSDIM